MACYHPLKAYRSAELNESGKRPIVFKSTGALVEGSGGMLSLPCGQCMGCRSDRSAQWGMRLMHEAKMHDHSWFVTLTYSDEHVPVSYCLQPEELQKFHKRVRNHKDRLRYFGVGEYGDEFARPHFHSILFGPDFPDLKRHRKNERGEWLYTSAELEELWPFGFHEVGAVTFESAAYVARYCMKKVNGDKADDHYWLPSPIDGRVYRRPTEFAHMSLKPGIGATWAKEFSADCYPSDFLVVDGRKMPVPKYYRFLLSEAEAEKLKRSHKRKALEPARRADGTADRLRVREAVHADRLVKSRLNRPSF